MLSPVQAAAGQHHWYDLSWVDWLSVFGILIGLPLTLVGLYYAWKQAKDAKEVAQATQDAIRHTERQIQERQLLLLIPQLRMISSHLDEAITTGSAQLARQHLETWRANVTHVRGILGSADSDRQDLQREMQHSVALASAAVTDLLRLDYHRSNSEVFSICEEAREQISSTCDTLTVWLGHHSISTPT
jgi:hypothetical protein